MASRYSDGGNLPEQPKGPDWSKWFVIFFSVILVLVIAGGILVYMFGHNLFRLTNYVSSAAESRVVAEEELPEEARETVAEEDRRGEKVGESELTSIHNRMREVDNKITTISNENVYNLLLVGVDRIDKSWNGNSDSMMLVSLNFKEERISIISIMRDTYVDIPEVGYNKINNSYARGGGKLLCATVTDNFNIDVSRYAAVDFENMIDIIDALGGIELTMTDKEVEIANGYAWDMCNNLGLDFADYGIATGGGTYHVGGMFAVAFARNRYVGNSDYARTERQRYVISQIIKRIKQMNAIEMMNFARKVLPLITHNVKESEIWDLIAKAPAILKFSIVQDRVPYDNLYSVIMVDGQDMLVPDWEETITRMHETIYGDGTISSNEHDIAAYEEAVDVLAHPEAETAVDDQR